MSNGSQAQAKSSPLAIGSDYLIAYVDAEGLLSFRVVQYDGPSKPMYDWGVHEPRDFKQEGIMIWQKIERQSVQTEVAKFYKGNKAKYYR